MSAVYSMHVRGACSGHDEASPWDCNQSYPTVTESVMFFEGRCVRYLSDRIAMIPRHGCSIHNCAYIRRQVEILQTAVLMQAVFAESTCCAHESKYQLAVLTCRLLCDAIVAMFLISPLFFNAISDITRVLLVSEFCRTWKMLGYLTKGTSRNTVTGKHASLITIILWLCVQIFTRGRQEDAHEFLLAVLDAVERDSKRALHFKGHDKVCKPSLRSHPCTLLSLFQHVGER